MNDAIAETILPTGQRLQLVHGDLTQTSVDAIVNAANAQLVHGGGLAAAIVRRGGEVIQEESDAWVREHGPITHASPAVTSAGHLPCKYIIHAVGPIWGEGDEDRKLGMAVQGALALAEQLELSSIGLSAISTGIYGFPKARGAQVILDSLLSYFEENPKSALTEIMVVIIDTPTLKAFESEFAQRWAEDRSRG
jgi:O-acetyl-ADP-ribose deacetylase (regulator of RNase III)